MRTLTGARSREIYYDRTNMAKRSSQNNNNKCSFLRAHSSETPYFLLAKNSNKPKKSAVITIKIHEQINTLNLKLIPGPTLRHYFKILMMFNSLDLSAFTKKKINHKN